MHTILVKLQPFWFSGKENLFCCKSQLVKFPPEQASNLFKVIIMISIQTRAAIPDARALRFVKAFQ